jgi:hypothetical protein
MRVAQHIEPHVFASRFSNLIQAVFDEFFVQCEIEFVSDLRTFAIKLSRLESIYKLTAHLYPPNPIFAPLWRSLKEYMEERGADSMNHDEEAKGGDSLNTELPKHVEAVAAETPGNPYSPEKELPIGDAAILMAADGYGEGLVHGREGGAGVVIRTSETIRNFTFSRSPDPRELARQASDIFETLERDRNMKHPLLKWPLLSSLLSYTGFALI